jgi:hypothetical protein
MVPGDMVLYESGSLMHARPFPLNGKFYANVFIHFEPTGRKLEDVDQNDMRYDSPNNPGNYEGGVLLPPYLIPGSPEAIRFSERVPFGWEKPKRDWDSEGSDEDEEELEASDDHSENINEESDSDESDESDEDDFMGEWSDSEDDPYLDEDQYVLPKRDQEPSTKHITGEPTCPSDFLLDPVKAPATCLHTAPLHKKIISKMNQWRKTLTTKKDRSKSL